MKPAFWTVLLAAVLVAACGTTPPSKLYTLESQAAAGSRNATGTRKVEIVGVRIPELWDRPQIVLTKSGGQVDFSEFNRWAVPLKAEVPRVVTRNLVQLLDTPTIWLREDFPGAKPDLRVQISIDQLEAVAGQHLGLEATWVVRATDSAAAYKVGRSSLREPLADASYEAVVAATNRALLAMSREIAKDIQASPAR